MRWAKLFVLMTIVLGAAPVAAELKAGVGKTDLTPPIGGRMYGYGARGTNVSTGVHDALYAKAIVLDDGATKIAIVTLDLGSITSENTANIKEGVNAETGIENILLIASHSHSTATYESDFPSAEAPYAREVERKIIGAIVDAAGSTRPAKIGIGWGEVREGHNRRFVRDDGSVFMLWGNRDRVPTAPLDYAVGVIRVDDAEGEPIATLVNFNCHPVVLGPENLEISADYPGAMMAAVESEIGGQCMFVQGAAGDINPFWDKTAPGNGAFEQVAIMGEALAREVVRVRGGVSEMWEAPELRASREVIELEHRWDINDPDVQAVYRDRFGEAGLTRYKERFGRELNAEVNAVMIGDGLAICGFPGEFFVEHGMALKNASSVEHTIFAGYCNGQLAYFPTIKAASEGGYGAAEATVVEVGAGERLVNAALIQLLHLQGRLSRLPRL